MHTFNLVIFQCRLELGLAICYEFDWVYVSRNHPVMSRLRNRMPRSRRLTCSCVSSLQKLFAVWMQVSRAREQLTEESKEHGLIVEREGRYLPVVDEPRRLKSKSQHPSDGK